MTDRKSPVDQALELFVYAPIGLAIIARESLPALIDKGRRQVSSQVTMARMMGQFAVAEGEKQVRERIEEVTETVTKLVDQAHPPASAGSTPSTAAAADAAPTTAQATPGTNGKATPTPTGAAVTGDHLAITGYDTLSASQVVQRLAGLSPAELEAVRVYEEQTRGRRTILSKVGQLQAEPKS